MEDVAQGERPVHDQLAREWGHIARIAGALGPERAWVIYVTTEIVLPRKDIADAQDDLRKSGATPGRFCWVSWRDLARVGCCAPVFEEILKLLERLDLLPFTGVRPVPAVACGWRFSQTWRWPSAPPSTTWSSPRTSRPRAP